MATGTMKAARYYKPGEQKNSLLAEWKLIGVSGDIRVQEVPIPEVKPGHIQVSAGHLMPR